MPVKSKKKAKSKSSSTKAALSNLVAASDSKVAPSAAAAPSTAAASSAVSAPLVEVDSAKNSKKATLIKLTLVLQVHKKSSAARLPDIISPAMLEDIKIAAYSQFKILQFILNNLHTAVVVEGVSGKQPRPESSTIKSLAKYFPQDKEQLLAMKELTPLQKFLIVQFGAHNVAQIFGFISKVYASAEKEFDGNSFLEDYKKIFYQHLGHLTEKDQARISLLFSEQLYLMPLPLEPLSAELQKCAEGREKALAQLQEPRELAALNGVLKAAKNSGKNEIILVYGKAHKEGFTRLIESQFKGQIELVKVYDPLEEYFAPEWKKQEAALRAHAQECEKRNAWTYACVPRQDLVTFWRAFPSKTVFKTLALSQAEFNFGCLLMRLAENNQAQFSEALVQFDRAVQGLEVLDEKNSKSMMPRYRAHRDQASCGTELSKLNQFPTPAIVLIICFALSEEPTIEDPKLKSAPALTL